MHLFFSTPVWASKIENFKTGIPTDNDAEIINIEPKENLENKLSYSQLEKKNIYKEILSNFHNYTLIKDINIDEYLIL